MNGEVMISSNVVALSLFHSSSVSTSTFCILYIGFVMRVRIIHFSLQLCAYQPIVRLICCSLARWLSGDFVLFQVVVWHIWQWVVPLWSAQLISEIGLGLLWCNFLPTSTQSQIQTLLSKHLIESHTEAHLSPAWNALKFGSISVSQALAASAWLVNVSQCAITDRGKTFSNAWPTPTGLLEV